ncbi:hypothetical protein AB0I68_24485 [Streptomyces sp. NPDC050448]|uniref:hypothetical protein n=1 Tax=Streptomyces sp. NPDC050448 TaxID=3155404 RepID=UPI0034304FFB
MTTTIGVGLTASPTAAATGGSVACSTSALTTAISNAAAGDTLSLTRHCTYHLTSAFVNSDGLPVVDKQLTINGHGATIVRDSAAAGAFRIFHVVSGGDLRLDDVTVRGGNAPGDGGGILVDGGGKLKLARVTVRDNTASVRGGGVAALAGATAVIKHSWFKFNNADTGGGLQSDGTVSADDTEFTRNHARRFGGAIDHDAGNAVFTGVALQNNTAAGVGGAVDIDGGTVEFVKSKILNNTSTDTHGGGIWNGASLKLTDTEVSGNVIGGAGGKGGGIYNTGTVALPATLVLKNSTVSRNSANGSGTSQAGGIYNTGGAVTLDHSTVDDNASTVAPGGVWTNIQFTVVQSTIKNNIPTNCAGSPVIVTGCAN